MVGGLQQLNNWHRDSVGRYSFSYGYSNQSKGDFSVSFGYNTKAPGFSSSAFGYNSLASGLYAFAGGQYAIATGHYSTAFGYSNYSSGYNSTSFGSLNEASGTISTAFGNSTKALGTGSTTFGSETTAGGNFSTASGLGSISRGYASTVVGIYNQPILTANQTAVATTTPLFIVGNGGSNSSRSNAMVVRKDGNVEVENLQIGGGTVISKQLAGTATVGSSAAQMKTFAIPFSQPFVTVPKFVATARNAQGYEANEIYVVSIKSITNSIVILNVYRIDSSSGWSQQLLLDWIAWEQ
jgi:hypothetical protein